MELDAEIEIDSDVEDDFVETTGVSRIVQALHAHTWSNLKMRGNLTLSRPSDLWWVGVIVP